MSGAGEKPTLVAGLVQGQVLGDGQWWQGPEPRRRVLSWRRGSGLPGRGQRGVAAQTPFSPPASPHATRPGLRPPAFTWGDAR